jgi:hypothetical protein
LEEISDHQEEPFHFANVVHSKEVLIDELIEDYAARVCPADLPLDLVTAAIIKEVTTVYYDHEGLEVVRDKPEHYFDSRIVIVAKRDDQGNIIKVSARLVLLGYQQRYGIDYLETFSPTVRWDTLLIFLQLCKIFDLNMLFCDFSGAYLEAMQPPGVFGQATYLKLPWGGIYCRVHRALYGQPHAGRQWYARFREIIEAIGFVRCAFDNCVFVWVRQPEEAGEAVSVYWLLIYVDDMIIAGPDSL